MNKNRLVMIRDIIEACAAEGLLIKRFPSVDTKE